MNRRIFFNRIGAGVIGLSLPLVASPALSNLMSATSESSRQNADRFTDATTIPETIISNNPTAATEPDEDILSVVVTDSNDVAVSLHYDSGCMYAPMIVAKGLQPSTPMKLTFPLGRQA